MKMNYELEILIWTILSMMFILWLFVINIIIYLLIRDGPYINEAHICYNCLKKIRIQPEQPEQLEQLEQLEQPEQPEQLEQLEQTEIEIRDGDTTLSSEELK